MGCGSLISRNTALAKVGCSAVRSVWPQGRRLVNGFEADAILAVDTELHEGRRWSAAQGLASGDCVFVADQPRETA